MPKYQTEEIDGVIINRFRGIPLVTILPDGRALMNTDQQGSKEIFNLMNEILKNCDKQITIQGGYVKNSKGEWTNFTDGMVVE